jgi:indolepyruvate ferredoxin oxidoreductase
MNVLQHFRRVRGTWLDPFRNTPERQLARELLAQYEDDVAHILARANSVEDATALAALPDKIRGYGHVRERHAKAAAAERAALREQVVQPHRAAA